MLRTVLLIRHGKTDWTEQKRYCGKTDVDLNEEGNAQAERLSNLAEAAAVERVYTSDMKRAISFARTAFKNKPLGVVPHLREMDFGAFEGFTYEQLKERHGEKYARWIDNPFLPIPEAEDFQRFLGRVRNAWKRVLSENAHQRIAVVSHAGPVSLIVADIRGYAHEKMWQIRVDTASITRIEVDKGVCTVQGVNDTGYLTSDTKATGSKKINSV